MTAQNYELTQDWMHTEGIPVATEARWGVGLNGQVWTNDKSVPQLIYWDKDGKHPVTNAEGAPIGWAGTGIACDNAGNIFGSDGWAGAGASTNYKILPAGGNELQTLKVTIPDDAVAGRMDYLGRAAGNIMSAEGGAFYITPQKSTAIAKIYVAEGKQDAAKSKAIALWGTEKVCGTDGHAQPLGTEPNIDEFAAKATRTDKTFNKYINGAFKFTTAAEGQSTTAGGDAVILNGKLITVNPSGTAYKDGFIVCDETGAILASYAETVTAITSAANTLTIEKVDEYTANIYQYVPGRLVAKYTFKVLPPAQDQVAYIIGEVDNINWNPTQGIAIYGSNNKYEGYAYFKANANFGITTKLGANDGDWGTLNSNRYGHPDGDAKPIPGIGQAQKLNKTQNAINCPVAGYYKVTVDLTEGNESITLDYVDKLRVIGSISYVNYNPLADWDLTSKHLVFTKNADAYAFDINGLYLENDDQFILTPVVENFNSWDRVNQFRIGAADKANNSITAHMTNSITIAAANYDGGGDKNIFVKYELPGSSTITVDLSEMTLSNADFSGVEENVAEKDEARVIANGGTIQVIGGNLTSIYSISGQLIVANSTEKSFNLANGLYIVTVDGKAHKVIIR